MRRDAIFVRLYMTGMQRRHYAPNRIRLAREMRGFSQEALGAEMESGLTGSTIAKLEKGRQAVSLDYLMDIARVLQVEPVDLLLDRGGATRVLPVIGRVSAGKWREALALTEDFMPVPAHLSGSNLFILRPDGDSMDLIVSGPGAFIVIDPEQIDLVDHKFYVLMNGDGEATFKQFNAKTMELLPCSTNPDHQPISIGAKPFTVIGRVIYSGQEL